VEGAGRIRAESDLQHYRRSLVVRRKSLTPTDPHPAILEVLILLMCPLIVIALASAHTYTSREKATYGLASLRFMVVLAGATGSIHFAQLAVCAPGGPARLDCACPRSFLCRGGGPR
jgi:hypothetical protein